jgi:hypothetical protein
MAILLSETINWLCLPAVLYNRANGFLSSDKEKVISITKELEINIGM